VSSPVLAVLLEKRHAPAETIRALADVLRVAPASLLEFHDLAARERTANPVLFEVRDLAPGDFVVELTLCGCHGLNADSELAGPLARRLGERVLGSIATFQGPLSEDPSRTHAPPSSPAPTACQTAPTQDAESTVRCESTVDGSRETSTNPGRYAP
jgi:hypothetical protein